MSRKKRPSSIGTRSPREAGEKLVTSLKALEGLCKLYDEGNFSISAEMCVTIERICKDELRLSRIQGKVRIVSVASQISKENLLPQWRLTVTGYGPHESDEKKRTIKFAPVTNFDQLPKNTVKIRYPDWWAEPVVIEGAARFGGMIPVRNDERVPFEKRRSMSRNRLINTLRNEMGGHYRGKVSDDYMFSRKWNKGISFEHELPDGSIINSIDHPECFVEENTQADAAIRCIAEELLLSDLPQFLQR